MSEVCTIPRFMVSYSEPDNPLRLGEYGAALRTTIESRSRVGAIYEVFMRRGTVVLVFFLLVAVGIIAASQFISNQPPLTIRLAADPLIKDWVDAAVSDFNASNSRTLTGRQVVVTVEEARDIEVWQNRRWTTQNHPHAWIPAAAASIGYARSASMPFEVMTPSLATTPLIWMGYQDRVALLTENDTATLDWTAVQSIAQGGMWSDTRAFVNLAFLLPNQTMSGLATLLSGAASFHNTADLSAAQLSDSSFRAWMRPIVRNVPNFNTIGADMGAFAARSGRAAIDLAIGPENQWLRNYNAITRSAPVQFGYPEYTVVFDFPLARWQDAQTTTDEQQAVSNLNNWLNAQQQQTRLLDFGLRPNQANIDLTTAPLFTAAAGAGISPTPTYTAITFPANSTDLQSLIRWFETERQS